MALPGSRSEPRARAREAGPSPSGTWLGFDFGERRIGVAVGERAVGIASPLATIDAAANEARFAAIAKLVAEWKPAGFVVGRPRHADGSEHAVAKLAEKFGRRLAARFSRPVAYVDETLSSAEAGSRLRGARTRARREGEIDAVAAAIILQSWLDDPEAHGDDAA
jgi:putative Holliday junction resolvase